MLRWPPGQIERATKCHSIHKQGLLVVNNHVEVAGGESAPSKTNQELIPDKEEKPPS